MVGDCAGDGNTLTPQEKSRSIITEASRSFDEQDLRSIVAIVDPWLVSNGQWTPELWLGFTGGAWEVRMPVFCEGIRSAPAPRVTERIQKFYLIKC